MRGFADISTKLEKNDKRLGTMSEEISTLREMLERQGETVRSLLDEVESMRALLAPTDGEKMPAEIDMLRSGWFDLNRGTVFPAVIGNLTPRCAFAVKPATGGDPRVVEYTLQNLERIRSYDGIEYAVEFTGGECTLAEAASFATEEDGTARLSDDGLWHIVKRTKIKLNKSL